MNIGDNMNFFFDRNNRIQVVDVPYGEYLVEVYYPSVKDIYVCLGDGEEYCRRIIPTYSATAKFFGHGCAKITRLS